MESKKHYWKNWFKAAGVRGIKTMAETALGMLSGGMMGLLDVDWVAVASVSVMSGIVSVLLSIKGLPEVKE